LFVDGFKNETQVIATVLSFDNENDPDIVAMIASSAALTLSGVPFLGPIGAARVGLIDGELVLNPLIDEMEKTKLDLVVAGTQEAVMMVESEAHELSEEQMLEAVMFGHRHFQPVIQAIIKLAETAAKEPWDIEIPDKSKFKDRVKEIAEEQLRHAYAITEKQKRREAVEAVRQKVFEQLLPEGGEANPADAVLLADVFKYLEQEIVRGNILQTGRRIDGRY